ncbi:hypothetical protein BV22DRAFT_1025103, partial [Leucogyrophana mollusca]
MSSQPWRRYALGLSIANNLLRVHCYDRSGVIVSRPYDIHDKPYALIRVFASLAFADRHRLGFDPTIKITPPAKSKLFLPTRFIIASDLLAPTLKSPIGTVMGKTAKEVYEILGVVWSSGGFIGRGTTVYHVRAKRGETYEQYVLKDYWVKASEVDHEANILQLLEEKKIEGVPRLADAWNVQFNGRDDSTQALCRGLVTKHLPRSYIPRIHRRLLMSPVAFPITSFRSQRELLSALRDAV